MDSNSTNPRNRRGVGFVTPNACTECRKKRAKVRKYHVMEGSADIFFCSAMESIHVGGVRLKKAPNAFTKCPHGNLRMR